MKALTRKRIAASCALVFATSCSDESERNVITERAPFYHVALPYTSAETERIVASVHRFADANGMDFLVSRDGPERGDYNVTAAGQDLNLNVLHVRAISDTTDVSAYTRRAATDADKIQAVHFVCVVKGECQP